MGGASSSSSGREGGAERNRIQKVSQKAKDKVIIDQAKDNATAYDNMKFEGSKAPSLIAKTLDYVGISNKSFEANKAYYEKNVSGKNNFTKSPDDFKRYMTSRGTGEIDAMGRATNGGSGGNSYNTEATKQVASSGIVTNNGIVAPTTAEVSQATSTMMSDAEISVANKKKGRSTTILNRATGLGNSSLNTTKKTLGA